MEASRPPLKRNRNKANVQMNKKYQHLNWPNALTKIENSNDTETLQSSSSGNFIIKSFLVEIWRFSLQLRSRLFYDDKKETKTNEDETKSEIQSKIVGQNIQGQLISGQETLVLPVDTKVLNADLSTIIKQNPNAKVYVVVPRQVNNQINKETMNWNYKQGNIKTKCLQNSIFLHHFAAIGNLYQIIGVIYRCPFCVVLSVITYFYAI